MRKKNPKSLISKKEITLGIKDDNLKPSDLIKIQRESWERFLNHDLKNIISEFFPIEDYTGKRFVLSFKDISFGEPRYSLNLCLQKKLTYDFPIYLTLTLLNKRTGVERTQDVYFFNLPKMTDRGTFIINGIERAVINQLVRSPGVYFTANVNETTGYTTYNAEIRPYIGAWLDFSINKNGLIEMKINKKRKFLATTFIRSFDGETNSQIIENYFKGLNKEVLEKYIIPTFKKDKTKNKEEAILEIYKKIRPGEPLILDNAYNTIQNLFYNPRRYSLSEVGRYKINKKLEIDQEIKKEDYLLSKKDIIETIKYLVNLTIKKGSFDDIDHLGNRRLRRVGELVGMYGIRVGMVRAEREIKERMSLVSNEDKVTPSLVVNPKSVILAVNSFFRTSQLSTIIDQTNLLF